MIDNKADKVYKIYNKIESSQIQKDNLEEDYTCPICQLVIWDPIQCATCKLHLCMKCAQDWIIEKEKTTCPVSGCEQFAKEKAHPFFYKTLSNLKLDCQNKKEGCMETVYYRGYQQHINECEYAQIQCEIKGCDEQYIRKNKQIHLENCLYLEQKCKWCDQKFIKKVFNHHQNEQCDLIKIKCPNESNFFLKLYNKIHLTGCNEYILKLNKEIHLQNCQFQSFTCEGCLNTMPYSKKANHAQVCELIPIQCPLCDTKLPRQKFQNHDKFMCLQQVVIRQKNEIKQLQEVQKNLYQNNQKMQNDLLELNIMNNDRKQRKKEIYLIKSEIEKLEDQIMEMLSKDFSEHLEKKHKRKFEEFDGIYRYFQWLQGTAILYQGWHKFHCSNCMAMVEKYSQLIEPIEIRRMALKDQVDQLILGV